MKKVIIMGAGPAGLTAGYELLRNNPQLDVTILEKQNSIGGISKTVEFDGNLIDLGGHRYFTKNERVMEWWNKFLKIEVDDKKIKSQDIMLMKSRKSSILYNGKYIEYPIKFNKHTISSLGIVNILKIMFSFFCVNILPPKGMSLEDFYVKRFGRKLYSMFFSDYTEKIWGKNPKEISSNWGNQRVQNFSISSIIKSLLKNKKTDDERTMLNHFYYPLYGSGQLWKKVANEFCKLGGKIIVNADASVFELEDNKICSVTCKDGREYNGDVFISSMPVKDFVSGIKNTPKRIYDISQRLQYREFVIVGLLIEKKGINKDKFSTENDWIYIQDKNLQMGRIQIFDNWSPMMNKHENALLMGVEFFCNKNDYFWNLSNKEWSDIAISNLIKSNILCSKTYVLKSHAQKVEKAYPAYWDGYYNLNEIINYINSLDNIFCIGRNGQHRYNNMDHSMETAFAAVDFILGKTKDKSSIWDVNTKQEYCEQKCK